MAHDPHSNRASTAGGFLLAVSIIIGAIVGSILREPSMGFLAGTAVGVILLGAVWLKDRQG